ncbi:MAG: hypothetical protein MJ016_08175, partial [Victivallaceae bacterium]|nr:hypothetical protein [Victivallaceae bacterium]
DFGEGYRRTQVKINGQSFGKFGDGPVATKGKPEYKWKRALLPVELTEGQMKIELIPLSASSRIDSIIFTDNADYKPSDDAGEVTDRNSNRSTEIPFDFRGQGEFRPARFFLLRKRCFSKKAVLYCVELTIFPIQSGEKNEKIAFDDARRRRLLRRPGDRFPH